MRVKPYNLRYLNTVSSSSFKKVFLSIERLCFCSPDACFFFQACRAKSRAGLTTPSRAGLRRTPWTLMWRCTQVRTFCLSSLLLSSPTVPHPSLWFLLCHYLHNGHNDICQVSRRKNLNHLSTEKVCPEDYDFTLSHVTAYHISDDFDVCPYQQLSRTGQKPVLITHSINCIRPTRRFLFFFSKPGPLVRSLDRGSIATRNHQPTDNGS